MASFTVTTRTLASCRAMFEAALSPELHAGSMARHQEQARATRAVLGLHDDVTFTARHFGRTWRMTSRIVQLDPDRSFVDEQTSGPFTHFRHTHTFVALEHGCEMTDHITYRARRRGRRRRRTPRPDPLPPRPRRRTRALPGRRRQRLTRRRRAHAGRAPSAAVVRTAAV